MDPREQDTREKLGALEQAIEGGMSPEQLFALAASGLVAIDFRATDAMIGIPEVSPELVHSLRAATYRALVKAADGGHVKAALALGERIWHQRDHAFAAHAVRALERVADADSSGRAHHLLAMFHFHGLGLLENKAASLTLHEKAAACGDSESMFELYAMLAQGVGAEPDLQRALEWCKQAAEAGNARAMYNLGAFHATGRDLPQDDALAVHWYGRAADAGHGRAAATLGVMLATGQGAHRDVARARQYLARAEELGADWHPLAHALGLDEHELLADSEAPSAAPPPRKNKPAERAKKEAAAKPARKAAPAKTKTKTKAKPKTKTKAKPKTKTAKPKTKTAKTKTKTKAKPKPKKR